MEKEFKDEKALHKAIAKFISNDYPRVIFSFEPSGMRVPMGIRMEIKAKTPPNWKGLDIPIHFPNKKYHSLILEVKTETPFRLDGQLKADKTIEEQAKTIEEHNRLGSFACFVWSLEQAKEVINLYMNDKL